MAKRRPGAARRAAAVEPVDGGTAELRPDPERARGWTLLVDGAPQSYVDLDDPAYLHFEYQRRIGHAVDLAAPPGRAVRALHLGGGALTLARYVAVTRPRSTQQVVEVDGRLTALVRRSLPLDARWRIRVRGCDARELLSRLPAGWADLVIGDVFRGARTPAHLTSVEYLGEVRRVIRYGGVYVANLADGPPLAYLRAQVATCARVFPELCLTAGPAVLRGRRFGNAVLLASAEPLPLDALTHRAGREPHPSRLLHGRALHDFTAGAAPVTDVRATMSPPPPPGAFA